MPWLSWTYSLIFPVAILALLVTAAVSAFGGDDDPDPTPLPDTSQSLVAELDPTQQAAVQSTLPADLGEVGGTPTGFSAGSTQPAATPGNGKTVEGTVVDASGKPIQGALVSNGVAMVVTGADGIFQIDAPAGGNDLTVLASGYLEWHAPADGDRLAVELERQQINALYFNPNFSYNDEAIQKYIDIINTTSANAVVIDVKEEIVYFDSKVKLFNDAGTVQPMMDLADLIKRFQDEGVYTIARLVVFKDGLVAQYDESLGVLNNQTGELWRDNNGVAWVNPMVHDLWQANVDLAVEVAGYGFDEIQYDYIRFPTDGDFSTMDFGLENTQENRENSVNGFLDLSRAALAPLGVRQSADVFGYSLVVDDDNGIGQNYPEVAARVDYISPMIYPSHWPTGTLNVPGEPNDYPYDVVRISMILSAEKGVDPLKVRPWLQDFDFPNMREYGDQEVADQIRAAEEAGASGWMIWDPNNWFHPGGFPVEETIPVRTAPAATPASASRERSRSRVAAGGRGSR